MSAATTTTPQSDVANHHDGARAEVPVQIRSKRFRSTEHGEFPAITGRELDWRLTPVETVRALIDDALDGAPLQVDYEPVDGVTLEVIGRDDARIGTTGLPEDRAAANAWTNFDQALAITVDSETPVRLRIDRSAPDATPRAAHTVITARPNSDGLIVLLNTGATQLTENVEIDVQDGARLTVVTVQEWDDSANHLAGHHIRVGRDATLKHIVASLGGGVVRVTPSAHLIGQGGDVELLGVCFADAGQHLEHRVFVHHDAPNTRSRVNYKGALYGEGARTVWVGDVLIDRTAPGTDSYEQNRNLMLSDGTRADSIPNLEIETGLIEGAGHASATGRFDDEQLFYLRARGITEEEARRLVVLGFLVEVVQQIGDDELERRLIDLLEAEVANSGSGRA